MRFEQHQDGYININNKEIYHSGLQLRWLKEFNVKPDIIFDFGSEYLGDSIRYRMNFPCEIFAFEANVNLYNKTIELAKEYNINLENIAISDVDGTIMFEEAIQNGEPVGCGTIMSRTEKYKNTFPSFEYMPKIPVAELHREEAPNGQIGASRFKWDVANLYFEEWQVAHFRRLTDSSRLPYGISILEPARKLWKQLQLAEDAMLVYRLIRSPERRVYYLEVGNIDPVDIPQYMEKMKAQIKKSPLVDPNTGNINLKYNPMPIWKNTPIPLLDGRTLTIEEMSKEYESGKINYVYSVQEIGR